MHSNINDGSNHPHYLTTPLNPPAVVTPPPPYPETFRLPRQHQRDPYWNLSRAWYYDAEKAGLLKLIRLRKEGNVRGVTLVPFRAVANLIHRAANEGAA